MKTVPLILAILLLAASGYGFLRAYENNKAAAGYQKLAEENLVKMKNTQDMAALEKLKNANEEYFLPPMAEHKQESMMYLGGGAVLLVGSILAFVKSRRPKTA